MGFDFRKLLDEGEPEDLLVGPFQEYRVVVEGRAIPGLTGYHEGDNICLVLDHRWAATFTPDAARQAAWLIANALAIGSGYSHLGAANKDQPFASLIMQVGDPSAPADPEPGESKER